MNFVCNKILNLNKNIFYEFYPIFFKYNLYNIKKNNIDTKKKILM